MPPFTYRALICLAAIVCTANPASAAIKLYDSSADNGEPTDTRQFNIATSPTLRQTPDRFEGSQSLTDDGTGTVTLDALNLVNDDITDFGPETLTPVFGPGAFVFIDFAETQFIQSPATSNTSGIGAHGPSGTGPGQSTEWGVLSGFDVTGTTFCIASPVQLCNQANFLHGATVASTQPSGTYDLGTWTFDAVGDLDSSWYINRTTNGGLTNVQYRVQGAFHGASLPALPLVGFGALSVALTMLGARTLFGRK